MLCSIYIQIWRHLTSGMPRHLSSRHHAGLCECLSHKHCKCVFGFSQLFSFAVGGLLFTFCPNFSFVSPFLIAGCTSCKYATCCIGCFIVHACSFAPACSFYHALPAPFHRYPELLESHWNSLRIIPSVYASIPSQLAPLLLVPLPSASPHLTAPLP